MTVYEIPLTPTPQTFGITLAGIGFRMTVVWMAAPTGGWVLNIADASGNPIVSGIALVTGADLLAQYAYLGFGGSLVVQTDYNTDALPTFNNLGISSHVYFVTNP